ncbi:ABC-F family ATP-binding cassette domain-containing protein [Pseudomonas asplenii]|uniref:ABC-F family ATP-binding cassette domain-containing protein n=1 Tax=Pseudomonas asplenii TaxID=53407 RepID=UPI0006B49F62|nr:ABC-F family ATP-binding cassette domain-containing protein [Pseudomonas fuscovaginae]KPA99680.1 ATPase component of ABC transporters with duplicated ATPase domain [Pseudomonas fuscovaginae]
MTNSYLALESVSYVLADGRVLFSGLDARFDGQPTAIVGRNGVGKSVLARLLAGQLSPAEGYCRRGGKVHYLAQQLDPHASIATLLGVQELLAALERIEAGGLDTADYDQVGERWDIRQQLQAELERHDLKGLDISRPVASLSGGEAMRVALAGASLSDAQTLILDEPSNHLDRPARQALMEQLRRWPRGLIVISHDRELLEQMSRIVELSSLGLRSYGGGYSFYLQQKAVERDEAVRQLEHARLERKRTEQSLRLQQARQEQRQARAERQAGQANQAPILLGRRKGISENTRGKQQAQQAAVRENLAQQVREAARAVEQEVAVVLQAPASAQFARRRVLVLDDLRLPRVQGPLSLVLHGQQRIGVVGRNGSGKSTLLKVLAGQLPPVGGDFTVNGTLAYLDQALSAVDPQRSILEQLRAVNRHSSEGELRSRLAQLGLGAECVMQPSGLLSGGERLKGALASVLYADEPPQLLLLDEPNNHLDLPSLQALESMLVQFHGALLVVSHDRCFLDRLQLTERLQAGVDGWQLQPWA